MQYKQISNNAIKLIKEFEGLSLNKYKCPAGKWTIGYGHVLSDGDKRETITEKEAELILRQDIFKTESYLNSVLKITVTQNIFDALVSLVFNWGAGNFGRSKGLKFLNEEKFKKAKEEFFSKEKGVVNVGGTFINGLYRRRQAEKKLWETTSNNE